MIRDYSNVPAKKTISNNTENDLIVMVEDIPVTVKPGEEVIVKVQSSEGLAAVETRLVELLPEEGEVTPESEEVTIEGITSNVSTIQTSLYGKVSSKNLTPESEEVSSLPWYTEIGESEEVDSIKINSSEYDKTNKSVSIDKNSFVEGPVFKVAEGKLLVSTLYLISESLEGKCKIEAGNKIFDVTLDGISEGDGLTLKEAKGANTQEGRENDVQVEGNSITQTSENGKHILGIILKSGEEELTSDSTIIYRIASNKNMGML